MKIILTQAIPGLGEAGTIKEVADGYARNFLLPKKMAVAATRGSVKQAEQQAELYARKAAKARSAVETAAAAAEGKSIVIRARAGSENRLYGSITPSDITQALASQHNVTVDRRKVHLAEPIHRLGTYTATIDFGSGVTSSVTVEVAPEVTGAHGRAGKRAAETQPAEASLAEPAAEDAAPATTSGEEQAEEQVEANPS